MKKNNKLVFMYMTVDSKVYSKVVNNIDSITQILSTYRIRSDLRTCNNQPQNSIGQLIEA